MKEPNLSISNFKKVAATIFLPVLFLFVLFSVILNYLFEQKVILGSEISGVYKINRIINQSNENEIPFFGSSRAEGNFIPDSLVKNGFNYGMSGTQDDVLLFCLSEECKKKKKTPIISNFDLDGLDYSLGDPSNYIYNSNYLPVRQLMGTSYKSIYKIPFIKYYGYFELYLKFWLNSKTNLTKITNKGASIEKNELTANKFNNLVAQRLKDNLSFHNDSKLLDGLISIIKTNVDRHFFFIISPYHNSCFNGFTNFGEAQLFLDLLKSYKNVTVLDFAKINFPDEYYLNTTHLNYKGALVFNRILKDSLNKYSIH